MEILKEKPSKTEIPQEEPKKEIPLSAWMEAHGRRVDQIVYQLEKFRLSGEYSGGLNVIEIITYLKSCKMEIASLHNQLVALKENGELKDVKLFWDMIRENNL